MSQIYSLGGIAVVEIHTVETFLTCCLQKLLEATPDEAGQRRVQCFLKEYLLSAWSQLLNSGEFGASGRISLRTGCCRCWAEDVIIVGVPAWLLSVELDDQVFCWQVQNVPFATD